MIELELNMLDAVKSANGVLLYRICSRNIIVYQYKALFNACLKDKIYFKSDLSVLTKRKNQTVLVNKPDIFAVKSVRTVVAKGQYKLINSNNMNLMEMIIFIKFNPDIKVSHYLFNDDQYIQYDGCRGIVKDNDGKIFGDWYSENVRIKDDDDKISGWFVKEI